jgi:hypothetical protein
MDAAGETDHMVDEQLHGRDAPAAQLDSPKQSRANTFSRVSRFGFHAPAAFNPNVGPALTRLDTADWGHLHINCCA